MAKYVTLKRIYQRLWLMISNLPMSGHGVRPWFVKMGGVKIMDPKHTFVGTDIDWDTVHPEKIIIESGVRLTARTCILTHFINPQNGDYTCGEVRIKRNAFIGTGTIITKPVTIGERAIVGAGSIVTKNIPDDEVWAGNPARFIRKR
ncbi:acyltransferase [Prevotella sp.]|nr:acyltransferase [Prevotella sp.]